jgi:hypothetical protein
MTLGQRIANTVKEYGALESPTFEKQIAEEYYLEYILEEREIQLTYLENEEDETSILTINCVPEDEYGLGVFIQLSGERYGDIKDEFTGFYIFEGEEDIKKFYGVDHPYYKKDQESERLGAQKVCYEILDKIKSLRTRDFA